MDGKKGIIITGAIVGIIAVCLVQFGNPLNMGLCIACFIRDIAGAVGLHRASPVQYIRPEIIGIVLGAFFMSIVRKEFVARGGSSPFIRFILGFFVMIGALMFLGCPLRMILRLGGGDINAIFGLIGFIIGIVAGIFFLKRGFSLKRNYKLSQLEGYLFPIIMLGLLILLILRPTFIYFSESGPGSMHAFLYISLLAGIVVGAFAQRTRLCLVGGIRDLFLFRDTYLILGFLSIFISVTVTNMFFGTYKLSLLGQPIAHVDGLWNCLGMILVGWGSALLGGCPLRQLILSGEGNIDSVMDFLGMLMGAAFSHNFALAASPSGPTINGKIAVVIGLVIVAIIAYCNTEEISFFRKGEIDGDKTN
ncbi:MAG: YedE family putative selenium transporter [Clostridia bacterium]|nr:YedE family putative selenium transporter [Clostridia bacterium]MDD4048276.1 YedE family putative selenium transporter [Clostridia bacterium]